MSKRFGLSAVMGVVLVLCASSLAAQALPEIEHSSTASTYAEAAVGKVAMSVETEDDVLNCTKSRKRMFVDGEGWIVRRVTTCR